MIATRRAPAIGMRFELRYVVRRLWRAPVYSLTILGSLIIGIATVLVATTIVDSIFLRLPDGLRDPGRIVGVGPWVNAPRSTFPDYADLTRDATGAFESLGAFAVTDYSVRIGSSVVPARAMIATHTLMPLLGTRLISGRWPAADEDAIGAPPVVVVSRELASKYLGNATSGTATVTIAGRVFTVVGVLATGFSAPDLTPVDVVVPMGSAPWFGGAEAVLSRNYHWLRMVGRLRPGVSSEQAGAQATAIVSRVRRDTSSGEPSDRATSVVAVRHLAEARRDPTSATARVSLGLAALSLVVLLIVCLNVGSTIAARSVRDRRATAIHAALGAPTIRMLLRVLLEVGLLASIGALLAMRLARVVALQLSTMLMGGSILTPDLDSRAVLQTTVVTIAVTLLCAAIPIARVMRGAARPQMAAATVSPGESRAMWLLAAGQFGLGIVLVFEALMFSTSLRKAVQVDIGIELSRLLVGDADLRGAGLAGTAAEAAVQRATQSIGELPGVQAVGMTNAAITPGFLTFPVSVPDAAPGRPSSSTPSVSGITEGFLPAVGIGILAGRQFSRGEVVAHQAVTIVSDHFAHTHFGNSSALGHCIRFSRRVDAECAEIIGVVQDRRSTPSEDQGADDVYFPLGSRVTPKQLRDVFPGREIATRSVGRPRAMAEPVRTALSNSIPELPSARVRLGDEYLDKQFRSWRLGAKVLTGFGLIAVVLLSVGVFGLTAQGVIQRQRELSIRSALGATPLSLGTLVFKQSGQVALVGALIGIVLTLVAARLSAAMVFGVSASDWRLIAIANGMLSVVTVFAAVVPAWRAANVDPLATLRHT
jgi:putative ABC transport system permease protein